MQEYFTIKSAKKYVFQTRSTAVAFCMLRSECKNAKPLRHLLPDTNTFDLWFDNVVKTVNGIPINTPVDNGLLVDLNSDLHDAYDECKRVDSLEIIGK